MILANPAPIHFFIAEKRSVKFEVLTKVLPEFQICKLAYVSLCRTFRKTNLHPEDEGIMSLRNV